jgi:hypothetical protein
MMPNDHVWLPPAAGPGPIRPVFLLIGQNCPAVETYGLYYCAPVPALPVSAQMAPLSVAIVLPLWLLARGTLPFIEE